MSNNSDSEKVLATVVGGIYAFTERFPDAWIYASGSTNARTRLYQMGISKFYRKLETDFELYGQVNQNWEEFMIGNQYTAFLARLKAT